VEEGGGGEGEGEGEEERPLNARKLETRIVRPSRRTGNLSKIDDDIMAAVFRPK